MFDSRGGIRGDNMAEDVFLEIGDMIAFINDGLMPCGA
jgi:hypothetical protein